jgi:LEA14-like dessication related protein
MKGLTLKHFALGALIVGLASYTIVYFKRQVELLKGTCFTFAGGVLKKAGFNSSLVTLYLRVKNRSDIDITILSQSYDVFINDVYVTNVRNENKSLLKAGNTSVLELDIAFSPSALLKAGLQNAESLLYSKENLMFTIKTKISAGSQFVFVNNIAFETKMSLAEYLAPSDTSFVCENEKHKVEKIGISKK